MVLGWSAGGAYFRTVPICTLSRLCSYSLGFVSCKYLVLISIRAWVCPKAMLWSSELLGFSKYLVRLKHRFGVPMA
jgi:hypothetical protein